MDLAVYSIFILQRFYVFFSLFLFLFFYQTTQLYNHRFLEFYMDAVNAVHGVILPGTGSLQVHVNSFYKLEEPSAIISKEQCTDKVIRLLIRL